jgi:hypothetical protein
MEQNRMQKMYINLIITVILVALCVFSVIYSKQKNTSLSDKIDNVSEPELKSTISGIYRKNDNVSLADVLRYESSTGEQMGKNLKAGTGKLQSTAVEQLFSTLYPNFVFKKNSDNTNERSIQLDFTRQVAEYAVGKIKNGDLKEVNDLFVCTELIFLDGTPDAQSLMLSFLEDFQTLFLNEDLQFEQIKVYLKPITLQMWGDIGNYWKAAARYKRDTEKVK